MPSLLRSVSVFRFAALAWAIGGVALSTEHLEQPFGAVALLTLMAVTTVALALWHYRPSWGSMARPWVVVSELLVGVVVLVGDGLVYADERAQSLPWSWPGAGVMAAGVVFGKWAGVLAAVAAGSASLVSEIELLERETGWVGGLSKLGLWLMAGALAGYVSERLQRAERQISIATARDEVARQLHDGVLQTLAVIQRRSDDDELTVLARDQEHELRTFLAGNSAIDTDIDTESLELEVELRKMAALHEKRYQTKVQVIVASDCPTVSVRKTRHLLGAVAEAVTNASKHGQANRITVYAEPAEDSAKGTIEVSVTDDGAGFDAEAMTPGLGISQSIIGRLEAAGGSADITSRPGRGTQVTLWV